MSRENVHSRERHANLLKCDLLWKLAIPRRRYCKGSVENAHSTEDKNVPIGRDVMVENVHSTESDSWEFVGNVHPTWIQSRRVL